MHADGQIDFSKGLVSDLPLSSGALQRAIDCQLNRAGLLEQRGAKTLVAIPSLSWTPSLVHGLGYNPSFGAIFTLTQPRQERWKIKLHPDITSGWWRMVFLGSGGTTSQIPWNATALQVRNAFAALPAVGAGNVKVTGSFADGWTLTFIGARAGTEMEPQVDYLEADVVGSPAGECFTWTVEVTGGASGGDPQVFGSGWIAALTRSDNGNYHFLAAGEGDSALRDLSYRSRRADGTEFPFRQVNRWTVAEGEMIGVSGSTAHRWGGWTGSRVTTGTVTTEAGKTTITGSGTSWTTTVAPGAYLNIDNATLDNMWYRVVDVVSNTELVVDFPPTVTVSGRPYAIEAIAPLRTNAGPAGAAPNARVACGHQSRLFLANYKRNGETYPHRITWSNLPIDAAQSGYGGVVGFHPNAYVDCRVGQQGGRINGLASLQGGLVVLRERSVVMLRGLVATDGSDKGASFELLSGYVGNAGYNSYDVAEVGLVWADRAGAYLSDGFEITNITDNRVRRLWRAYDMGNAATIVSALDDRVIFKGPSKTLVWDFRTDSWWEQSFNDHSRILPIGDQELAMVRNGSLCGRIVDWASDHTGSRSRADVDYGAAAAQPRLDLVSQPMRLSPDPFGQGRPQNLLVQLSMPQPFGLTPSLLAGLESVDLAATDSVTLDPITTSTSTTVVGAALVSELLGAREQTVRRRVAGHPQRSMTRVRLLADVSAASNAAAVIYGITLESSESSTRDATVR